MKPFCIAAAVTIAGSLLAHAGESTKPCCVGDQTKVSSCCATAKPAAAAVLAVATPVSSRSLYQLEATWTNDDGAAVQLASFRHQPVIIAMFFTQCSYACPMLVSDLERVQAGLPASVRDQARVILVSFDTQRDTPAALHTYRERNGLNASWTLLHGGAANVQELAMLLGVRFKQDESGQFAHSNVITVLNGEGEIVHQRPGLQGEVSEIVAAVSLAATPPR